MNDPAVLTSDEALGAARLHAQVAAAVELYTIPLYLSALASIKPTTAFPDVTTNPAYVTVQSVCTEEMLHLQLAANICLALGTVPNFTAPDYGQVPSFPDGTPILAPSDDPATGDKGVLNARIGNLIDSIDTMLDIEVPTEYEPATSGPPYDSIGQMYDALVRLAKLASTAVKWPGTSTGNQQSQFTAQPFPQTVGNLSDLENVVQVICEQGEGKLQVPAPSKPYEEGEFRVTDVNERLTGMHSDPEAQAQFSHFGRFLSIQSDIKTGTLSPADVYSGVATPASPENQKLQKDFAALISTLNSLWSDGEGDIWAMTGLLRDVTDVWAKGQLPQWT